MNWFYQVNHEWHGPVNEERLSQLFAQKRVDHNTLVRRGGENTDRPLEEVFEISVTGRPNELTSPSESDSVKCLQANQTAFNKPHEHTEKRTETKTCVHSGETWPTHLMTQIDGRWLCKKYAGEYNQIIRQTEQRQAKVARRITKLVAFTIISLCLLGIGSVWAIRYFHSKGSSIDPIRKSLFATNATPEVEPASWVDLPFEEWPQIMLVNSVTLKGGGSFVGGSGFLIEAANEAIYGITERRVLESIIGRSRFQEPRTYAATTWEMFVRQKRNLSLQLQLIEGNPPKTERFLGDDRYLLLAATSENGSHHVAEPLRLLSGIPKTGQMVYVITGTSEPAGPTQRVVNGKIAGSKGASQAWNVEINSAETPLRLAPSAVIDQNGFLIGITSGSSIRAEVDTDSPKKVLKVQSAFSLLSALDSKA